MERESTEYLYFGSTGQPPSVGVEVAFLAAEVRPTSGDWKAAVVVTSEHALWADAVSSGVVRKVTTDTLASPRSECISTPTRS